MTRILLWRENKKKPEVINCSNDSKAETVYSDITDLIMTQFPVKHEYSLLNSDKELKNKIKVFQVGKCLINEPTVIGGILNMFPIGLPQISEHRDPSKLLQIFSSFLPRTVGLLSTPLGGHVQSYSFNYDNDNSHSCLYKAFSLNFRSIYLTA